MYDPDSRSIGTCGARAWAFELLCGAAHGSRRRIYDQTLRQGRPHSLKVARDRVTEEALSEGVGLEAEMESVGVPACLREDPAPGSIEGRFTCLDTKWRL